jgi:hypothetical protein
MVDGDLQNEPGFFRCIGGDLNAIRSEGRL